MSTVILWPQTVCKSRGSFPGNALGQPDGKAMGLNANEYVEVGNFQGGFHPDLLPILNGNAVGRPTGDAVTAEMLARTNVIAFEVNGEGAPGAGGWESCQWVFNDGVNPPIAVDWDEGTTPAAYPAQVVANGSTDSAAYAAFFDFTFPAEPKTLVVSYILFDLPPTIDITSPHFTITVSAWADGQHGEGTPDPDAIGILACTGQ